MKRALLVLFAFSLAACLPTTTPPPPTPVAATDTPTAAPPPTDPATALPPTETPTAPPTPANVMTFPNPDAYIWETVAAGLVRPVNIQSASDGSGRLFIIEKVGRIRILQDGKLLDSPFLDISNQVGSGGNEQGLLGLAFHPNYAENGLFFVNYTDKNGNTVIARYHVTADPNVADPNSEVALLHVDQPFAKTIMAACWPLARTVTCMRVSGTVVREATRLETAKRLNTLLGKILRLDVDSAEPYAVPPDNPFGNEIWAYGLRNPWRFSFDRLTDDLYIGDVGQNTWEEIDFVTAGTPGGLNFGWNYFEGMHPYQGTPPSNVSFTPPVAEYSHDGGRCSVTGGYVYRGSMPEWNGIYLYGDYCTGTVWGLIHSDGGWQNQVLFDALGNITSFGQDESGEVYIVLDGGQILRLVAR